MSALRDHPTARPDVLLSSAALAFVAALATGCGSSTMMPPPELPPKPVALSPVGGTQVTTDLPVLSVQNAKGFDSGQATYAFHILNQDGSKELATFSVPAGAATTQSAPPSSLPRGHILTWNV